MDFIWNSSTMNRAYSLGSQFAIEYAREWRKKEGRLLVHTHTNTATTGHWRIMLKVSGLFAGRYDSVDHAPSSWCGIIIFVTDHPVFTLSTHNGGCWMCVIIHRLHSIQQFESVQGLFMSLTVQLSNHYQQVFYCIGVIQLRMYLFIAGR